jgi:antitoxin component YwqK of YwqJK toxin-antitoxin module
MRLNLFVFINVVVVLTGCASIKRECSNQIDLNYSNDLIEQQKSNEIEKRKIYEVKQVIKDTLDSDSLLISYYANGQRYRFQLFKNGKLNGRFEEYYSNGQLHFREHYVNGIPKDGRYYSFAINGSFEYEINYKDGKEHGLSKYYFFGELTKIRKYRHGNLIYLKVWNDTKCKFERNNDY